jgi:type I restriction enzyme S subunit
LPPEDERRVISEFVGALDNRITLLRETNATLEAIAQALFKSWFVDFDPVRAKMEGRAPEGMDEATAALFPDSFEESAMGLVPKGWRVGILADLSDLNPESWTAKNHPDIIAYIDLANAKDNEIASVTDFDFDEAPSRARRVLRSGDTIVGTVRPGNRSFAFIHEPASNLTASTGFAVLRPSALENTEFVYLAATQASSIEHLAHVADGAAYPAVRPDVVSGLQSVVADGFILKAFHVVAAPLLAKVSENQKQAQTLATLRDTLLPRLISGSLRLPQ